MFPFFFSSNFAGSTQYFGIVNSAISYLKTIPSKKKIGSIIISDSVILQVPHGKSIYENIDRLRGLAIAVGIIQQHLAMKNIWIRGAISSGDSYFDIQKSQIVGPAYINAYLLEKSIAIFPRVVIDSKLVTELHFDSATNFIEEMNEKQSGGLKFSNWGSGIVFDFRRPNGVLGHWVDQDVPLFIDYLLPVFERGNQDANLIIQNIKNSIYQNTEIYKKFKWVAQYSISICEKLLEFGRALPSDCLSTLQSL